VHNLAAPLLQKLEEDVEKTPEANEDVGNDGHATTISDTPPRATSSILLIK